MKAKVYFILLFLFLMTGCVESVSNYIKLPNTGPSLTPEQSAELEKGKEFYSKARTLDYRHPLPPLHVKAFPYYEKSAMHGHKDGILKTVEILTNQNKAKRYGTEVNPEKVEKFLIKGSEFGYPECVNTLADFYLSSGKKEKAIQTYEQAIGMGNRDAYFTLGMLYEQNGQYDNARSVYERSGESNSGCLYRYARLMELGLGGPQSETKAIALFDRYWHQNGNHDISYAPPRQDWTPIFMSMPKAGITYKSKTWYDTEDPRYKWKLRAQNNAVN